MSNENKTALTAEEQAIERYGINESFDNNGNDNSEPYRFGFVEGFNTASLQTQEKDKEIAMLEKSTDRAQTHAEELLAKTLSLQSTIESQQKEIEELKAQRMVDAECISQSGAYRIESTKQLDSLQSQLSEVTKERDELREGINEVLNKDAELSIKRGQDYNWELRNKIEMILESLTSTKEETKTCEELGNHAPVTKGKEVYCSRCNERLF